jgi:hypothetical protein
VESLERFRQSHTVIEDFTSRTLAAIRSDFGRLYYVSSLKDPGTGSYEHDGLKRLYSEGSVQSALAHCHAELFSRILETPLENQEHDLRQCLEPAGEKFCLVLEAWREQNFMRTLCPDEMPEYMGDLFCSNVSALLGVFSASQVS